MLTDKAQAQPQPSAARPTPATEDFVTASLLYHAERQCSDQWRLFLDALAVNLEEQLEPADLRIFMRRVGDTMGRQMALELNRGDSGERQGEWSVLEAAANRVWAGLDWGFCRIDNPDYLRVRHFCAPLRAAFSSQSMHWVTALLEGVYGRWFRDLRAGRDLVLIQAGAPRGGYDCIEFRLGPADLVARSQGC